MDLLDIFSGQESWHTRRLLVLAKTLNDEQLDCPLENQMRVFPWNGPDQSLKRLPVASTFPSFLFRRHIGKATLTPKVRVDGCAIGVIVP
jgi:hypothetical protein